MSEKNEIMRKKRQDLTLKEKISILEQYDELPKMSQRNAAAQLNVSQPVLWKILKNRAGIEDAAKGNRNLNSKRKRSGKDDQVEAALKRWFISLREHGVRVDGPLIRQKAKELAQQMGKEDFVVTEGWFRRWKTRENIVFERPHNQQKEADWTNEQTCHEQTDASWTDEPSLNQQRETGWATERSHNQQRVPDYTNEWSNIASEFTTDNIYNLEEAALYYRALSDYTYVFRRENAKGCNASKDHVTVLCCANMSGDKEKLLVIGKSKNPRSFKGVKSLPVHYYSNSNACMTSLIFNEWLMKWDNALDRKIALIMDNCTVPTVNFHPKNIKVIFIPGNIASRDRGMVSSLKANYLKEMRARVFGNVAETECTANDIAKKTDLLQAVHLIAMSWYLVTETMIKNCFRYSEFSEECVGGGHVQPPDMIASMFQQWMAMDGNSTERLAEENICEVVMPVENDELEKGDVETAQPPTVSEMREALEVLRRGVQHRASDFEMQYQYETFVNGLLREQQRQTTLDEFFSCSLSS